jgi:MerR family transcriptional regulator/heat shock protein HspR
VHNNRSPNIDPIISIGTVADKLATSVSSIRKYEAEGFIIPYKSDSGHRLFSLEDIGRIRTIQHLIKDYGLNLEGIRRLQALLPCWKILPCSIEQRKQCPAFKDHSKPCWMINGVDCEARGNECRPCHVYRFGSLYIEKIKEIVYRGRNDKEISRDVKNFLNKPI